MSHPSTAKRRRLLAVMFTDVVGYTTLMQQDEESARIARRRHREELEAAVEAHGGDLLQYLGDGSLTVFPNVVDAVQAAIEVQKGLREDPAVPLRIGIHQGDIAYDTQGAYGDSLNIAARIQSLGTAGSILISAKAYDEIKNQPDIATTSLGEFELKNVDHSLEVFGIVSEELAVPDRDDLLRRARTPPPDAFDAHGGITRLNVALEGRYRVQRRLGEGGMATVYLADDLRHERSVALKIMKPELAAAVGADRFLAEIKTTANLQHPRILPLFDSGQAGPFLFYVMPYVEGESLRERLDREGQLPVEDAVRIARSVGEALDYAHRRGVIHRDVTPGNVLLQDGMPVISDFGIALAARSAGSGRLTETGRSVGTPYYMSPEQASADREPTAASDVYSLGCVLYEMLVGEPPHTGSSAHAVLAKILTGDTPAPVKARTAVPAHVDGAVRKALEKLPADRFTNALQFVNALDDPTFRYGGDTLASSADARRWASMSAVFAIAALVFASALAWSLLRPGPPPPVARFSLPFEEGQAPKSRYVQFLADNSGVAYVGQGPSGESTQLWIRRWERFDATRVPGTEGVTTFRLSPDGREVAFATGLAGPLRVVPLEGGPGRTLVDHAGPVYEWAPDGKVYFTIPSARALGSTPEDGQASGVIDTLTTLRAGESAHAYLRVLPGGEMAVFEVFRAIGGRDAEVWALDLATGERHFLADGHTPSHAPTGHLLYGRLDGVLMAAPIDPVTATLLGSAQPIAEGLAVMEPFGVMTYAMSEDGTLVYVRHVTDPSAGTNRAVWMTRTGQTRPVDPEWRFTAVENPSVALSPSGDRLAITAHLEGNDDIWVKRLPDGAPERLTFDDGDENGARWSGDGRFVIFLKEEGGSYDVWRARADGSGAPELLLDAEQSLHQVRATPDGRWIVARRVRSSERKASGTSSAFDPASTASPLPSSRRPASRNRTRPCRPTDAGSRTPPKNRVETRSTWCRFPTSGRPRSASPPREDAPHDGRPMGTSCSSSTRTGVSSRSTSRPTRSSWCSGGGRSSRSGPSTRCWRAPTSTTCPVTTSGFSWRPWHPRRRAPLPTSWSFRASRRSCADGLRAGEAGRARTDECAAASRNGSPHLQRS